MIKKQPSQPFAFCTLSEQIEKHLKEGVQLEIKRFRVAEQFPVSPQMAEIHYKANWFGMRTSNEDRVCPCCLQRIKQKQFGFFETSMSNNFLSSDIILLFQFIRTLLIFLVLKIIVTDSYSIWINYHGNSCGIGKQRNCKPDFFSKVSIINRIWDQQTLFITDLLNLTFLILSIAFWTVYQRYSYKRFINIAAEIQTQDDYTLFVEDIPVVQDINQGVIDYRRSLKQYFNSIVIKWLQNPTNDQMYKSYLEAAAQHNHAPNSPPKIVSKINLCWNLYELTAIHDLKDQIQDKYENNAKQMFKKPAEKQGYQLVGEQTADELRALNTTETQLCQQFQINQKFGFALSRFLGKAFISFQYQHFAMHVANTILTAKQFQKDIHLKVSDAAFPRDVYWKNLNLPQDQREDRIRTTYTITIGCLIFAFLAFLGIKYGEVKYQKISKEAGWICFIFRMSTSLLSVGVTMLLYWVIDQLSLFEEHQTKTRYEISYLWKAISAVIINNIINICIAHYLLKIQIWNAEGLVLQVINTLILWYITQTLYHSAYLKWILRWIKLKWKYRSSPILKFQNRFNIQYVLPTFPLTSRYSSYLSDLYYLCFFSYLAPITAVIGLPMFFTYYYIDKLNILKRSSFHPNFSYQLIDKVIHLAQTSTLVFALGNYLFSFIITGKKYNPINLMSVVISIAYIMIVWGNKRRIRCFEDYVVYEKLSYSDCIKDDKFFDTYSSLNPATKLGSAQRRNKLYLGVNAPINAASSKPTAATQLPTMAQKSGQQETVKQTKA